MLELWINGRLSGYFKVPSGYTPQEWVEEYNERQRNYYESISTTRMRIRAL